MGIKETWDGVWEGEEVSKQWIYAKRSFWEIVINHGHQVPESKVWKWSEDEIIWVKNQEDWVGMLLDTYILGTNIKGRINQRKVEYNLAHFSEKTLRIIWWTLKVIDWKSWEVKIQVRGCW